MPPGWQPPEPLRRFNPCWDIETTEGFEAHTTDLLAYRKRRELEWEGERTQRETDKLAEAAHRFGTDGNPALTKHLLVQEESLAAAHREIESLQTGLDEAKAEIESLRKRIQSARRGDLTGSSARKTP